MQNNFDNNKKHILDNIIPGLIPLDCEWKGINRKQSTRWQHLSQLKASVFFSLQIFFSFYETQQLGLVLPSGGWQSLIKAFLCFHLLFTFSELPSISLILYYIKVGCFIDKYFSQICSKKVL